MIYLLGLSFLLFLNYKQVKNILVFVDSDLQYAGPDTKVMCGKFLIGQIA